MLDVGKNGGNDAHFPIHVLPLIYFYERDLTTPESLLERYTTIRPLAQALHKHGARVTVVQRFHTDLDFSNDGIRYRFCADSCTPALRKWEIPLSFHRAVRAACAPDDLQATTRTVIHLNGLLYPLQLRTLRNCLPTDCSIVVQHHAEAPWSALRRPVQRWGLRAADGFFFAAEDLGIPWLEHGLISKRQSIFQIMEGSCHFQFQDRVLARSRTRLVGNPVVLWVGRLIPLKDPLTVLDGFVRILQQAPEAKLYMAYGTDDMLPAVRKRIAASKTLADAVTLLGRVEHSQLEDIYNSADYFVLGSHREGSGFSLAEAMACGVVPVVTDIPSFRAMTDGGRIGGCWRPGSSESFAETFLGVMRQSLERSSHEACTFFQSQLSYEAIGRDAMRAYCKVIAARQGTA